MGCDHSARALQASDEDERRDDPRESARRGHRRAMRYMGKEARRRYANSMDTDDERDMVGAIQAELDREDEEREAQRAASDGEDREKDKDGLESRIASMMQNFTDSLRANYDVRPSKFTQDVTPRVATISERLSQHGISPKPFQAAVATRGLQAAIAEHVPASLQRDTSINHDGTLPGDAPALQASAGSDGRVFVGMRKMLGGAI